VKNPISCLVLRQGRCSARMPRNRAGAAPCHRPDSLSPPAPVHPAIRLLPLRPALVETAGPVGQSAASPVLCSQDKASGRWVICRLRPSNDLRFRFQIDHMVGASQLRRRNLAHGDYILQRSIGGRGWRRLPITSSILLPSVVVAVMIFPVESLGHVARFRFQSI
jgi:hypothetical protein